MPSTSPKGIPVSETFESLQGEGPYIGMPAQFIRTAYCNLHCTWCDAWYTWDHTRVNLKDTKWMNQSALRELFTKHPLTVLTGGEPLLWKDQWYGILNTHWIYDRTIVQFETNGTRGPGALGLFPISWVVSPKLANNGADGIQRRIVPEAIEAFRRLASTYWKFVVGYKKDITAVMGLVREFRLREDHIFLMPLGTSDTELREVGLWLAEVCKKFGWRYSDRLHIHLYGDTKGT